jgi:hypothetical protein
MTQNAFSFHIDRILGGMIRVLDDAFGGQQGYAKSVLYYKGQFSHTREGVRDTVKNALGTLAGKTPCFIVCFAGGQNVEEAKGAVYGTSITYLYKAVFAVFAVDADSRGQEAQARGTKAHPGTVAMIGDALEYLAALQFEVEVAGQSQPVILNTPGLKPAETVVVDHLPNVTAYGQYFDTAFHWQSKSRLAPGVPVQSLIFDAEGEGGGSGDGRVGVKVADK